MKLADWKWSKPGSAMSALGQKRTSRHLQPMSDLPPIADIGTSPSGRGWPSRLPRRLNQFLDFKIGVHKDVIKVFFADDAAYPNAPISLELSPKPRALAGCPCGRSTMKNEEQWSWGCLSDMPPKLCFLPPAVFCSRASHTTHTQSGDWNGCVQARCVFGSRICVCDAFFNDCADSSAIGRT